MRDETITALDALAALDPPANPLGLRLDPTAPDDEVAVAIDRERSKIAETGEQRAREAHAAVGNRRGLLLLFDVLVGITMGYLTHDQNTWVRRGSITVPHCGTFRCLAGWLAQAGFPTSRPVFGQTDTATVEHQFPDGSRYMIPALATCALLNLPPDPEPISIEIERMFMGGLDLADVWERAGWATGGVVTLPTELADEVRAQDAARWAHLDDRDAQ